MITLALHCPGAGWKCQYNHLTKFILFLAISSYLVGFINVAGVISFSHSYNHNIQIFICNTLMLATLGFPSQYILVGEYSSWGCLVLPEDNFVSVLCLIYASQWLFEFCVCFPLWQYVQPPKLSRITFFFGGGGGWLHWIPGGREGLLIVLEGYLILDVAGSCQGVIALNMEDGTLHRFRAASTILATGVL